MEIYLLCTAILTGSVTISEICSNPPDETAGEFVELYNDSDGVADVAGFTITDGDALDGMEGWSGSFPHSGVTIETTLIPPWGYAVILEEDYPNDPWLTFQPGTVILTTADHAICNGLAASSDPLTLFDETGTGIADVLSTYGTPNNTEEWENRDDDGIDSIPFDPGEGSSISRYPFSSPDCESGWFAGEPSPGGPPDAPPDTFVISVDSLFLSSADPVPGTGVSLVSIVSCWGTVPPDSGSIILYIDMNGDSTTQMEELLLSVPAALLQPGTSDTLEVFFSAPEQGWYPAVCSTPHGELRLHFSTGGGVNPVITEVMANPASEDTEEFIEVYYSGPGVFPLEGCTFTDGDALDETVHYQNSAYISSGQAGLIIDPEYTGTLNIPQGTPLFIPGNTTIGNGLTADDPILLYRQGGSTLEYLLSTAGTPLLYDDPLMCDDNGFDSIPFDPGDGCSLERTMPGGPDAEFNWQASQPGGTPGIVPENQGWTDLSTDTIGIDNGIRAVFSNCGIFTAQGQVSFFSDLNGDLQPGSGEILHQVLITLEAGEADTITITAALQDSGLFTVAAAIENPQDTITVNNVKYMQYIPLNPSWPVITEVLCNPENEDCDEFVELFFPGPGQADLTLFSITDNDVTDELTTENSPFAVADSYALVLDPEYENGSQPYDIPPGTAILYPGNTTIGDGLSGTDPVVLLLDSASVSTYGTPDCSSDDIPYDPGTGLSVERVSPALPDLESSWVSSPWGPTPGGPPENITEGVDYAVCGISAAPPMGPSGTETVLQAALISLGTDSVEQGELLLIFSSDGDPVQTLSPAIPGLEDTVSVALPLVSQENGTLLQATVSCSEDQQVENNTSTFEWNPPPSICINEIFYQEPEWVELFNGTDLPVNLCSLTFADAANLSGFDETVLDPGALVILTGDTADFINMWGSVPCDIIELASWPSLNNSGDSLHLAAGAQPIDMVPYHSSWGGSSASSLERRSAEAMGFLQENWGSCTEGATPGRANSIGEAAGGEFLKLSPTVFNPPGTPLLVTVNLPMQACNVTVKVYDVRGMELVRLHDGIVPGETLVLEWEGNTYPVGRYIIYAEANCAGSILTDAGVVVLARPLN